jgi:protein involved in polysaccharide export with SLBB domain
MTGFRGCRRLFVSRLNLVLASVLLIPIGAAAQDVLGTQRRQASRAELEQAIAAAEQTAASTDPKTREKLISHAQALRQRLKNGDFLPGDRLMITVVGDSALTDTFTVRNDQRLQLPNIPEISLRGVLDSELSGYLRDELAKYLKDPTVTATGLIRLAVMGAIGQPGFTTVPVDHLVTDVLMGAGGPASSGNMDKAYVKRGDKKLLNEKQFAEAVRTGKTVGDISLRDGDEIYIPNQPTGSRLQTLIPVISTLTGLYFIIRFGRGRGF